MFVFNRKKSDITPAGLRCPICNKILSPQNSNGLFLEEPLPCPECFQKFKRRRSSQPRPTDRRQSDLSTITEIAAAAAAANAQDITRYREGIKHCTKIDIVPAETEFRQKFSKPIRCSFCSQSTIIYLSSCIDHLKSVHSAVGFDNEERFYVFKNGSNREGFEKDGVYIPDYFKHTGKFFLSQGCNKSGIFYGWVSILGSAEDAKQFRATVILICPGSKEPEIEWTVPVQPFGEKEPSFSSCYSFRWDQLKPLIQKNLKLSNGMICKYAWSTKIEISDSK